MSIETLYPPAPENVPGEVTRVGNAYRLRVLAMIGGLFIFLILYLVFIAAAGAVAYLLLRLPTPDDLEGKALAIYFIFKFGGAFAMLLVWLFLFKGLFKGQKVERSSYLTLNPEQHPALFEFIQRVCRDTRSRRPRRVYVSPEVNAALVYNASLINLVIPPRKDLLIGLGPVNVVNLSEFKAVLAHEFGHFAQRSVGLGSFLYVANRVMHDVVYRRDALDRFVEEWSRQDVRVGFPALGLKGVLVVVRAILSGVYKTLNLLHLSLSRQMEYNADNVAVSVTGSDALIRGLARFDFASECLANSAQSLVAAADHGLHTDDLFAHQTQAAASLRRLRQDDRAGLPPDLPDDPTQPVTVFQPEEDGIPERYRSHPTHEMREKNAKRIYVRSPRDDRSPWLLFENRAELTQAVTGLFYRHVLGRREEYRPRSADEVQRFIDAETAETTYNPKYHGFYDDRMIDPGDVAQVPDENWSDGQIGDWLAAWPPADLQQRVAAERSRRDEEALLEGLKRGDLKLKGKTFSFRGQHHSLDDVKSLLEKVEQERETRWHETQQLDRQVFLAHWSLARSLDRQDGPDASREVGLLERYRFHMTVQELLGRLMGSKNRLQFVFRVLTKHQELFPQDFAKIRKMLDDIRDILTATVNSAQKNLTPPLTNVPAGSPLISLIADPTAAPPPPPEAGEITGEWLSGLATQTEEMFERVKRVHFKSLGSLLACQEKMAEEWGDRAKGIA